MNKLDHLSIIMDGNRRWAQKNDLPFFEGHKVGSNNIRRVLELCIDYDIKFLSVYAFSSENWGRDDQEIEYLKQLIIFYLETEKNYFISKQIKLKVIGGYAAFGRDIEERVEQLESTTEAFDKLTFVIALNYGSKNEIIRAVKNIAKDINTGIIDNITDDIFSKYLYTADIPDPDLMIRTGGERRLSNYFLWQLSYSEIIFEDTMWPDFNEDCFKKCLQIFYKRHRRVGK